MKQNAMSILKLPRGQVSPQRKGLTPALVVFGLGLMVACQPGGNSGLNTGSGGDFVPGQSTPTSASTPTQTPDPGDACAPTYSVVDDSPSLVFEVVTGYSESCQQYLKVEASYSVTCGAFLGGHLLAELSFDTGSDDTPTEAATDTPSETATPEETPTPPAPVEPEPDVEFYIFLEAASPLLDYDFGAATVTVYLPIEAINRTEWSMDITLVDDEGYPSEAVTLDISLTDMDVEESELCASTKAR